MAKTKRFQILFSLIKKLPKKIENKNNNNNNSALILHDQNHSENLSINHLMNKKVCSIDCEFNITVTRTLNTTSVSVQKELDSDSRDAARNITFEQDRQGKIKVVIEKSDEESRMTYSSATSSRSVYYIQEKLDGTIQLHPAGMNKSSKEDGIPLMYLYDKKTRTFKPIDSPQGYQENQSGMQGDKPDSRRF